jgi:hypothetical protein
LTKTTLGVAGKSKLSGKELNGQFLIGSTYGSTHMAYDARVFRILIASPSDVEDEREIAVRVIHEWNDLYSHSRNVALLPLRWETHTAPEYGVRPQEIINRAIVDECDLLVGIFWTRVGSPTGIAESGTLEEIERVGTAGKPIMLYFPRVEIDPERIDLTQIERLKKFKEKTYPKGLVENFKKAIEFRDKFAKQLELKIRDLQRSDSAGASPLSLNFLSLEDGNIIGDTLNYTFIHHKVKAYEQVPVEKRELLVRVLTRYIKARNSLPVALAIQNISASGIRNIYVELNISATEEAVEVADSRTDVFEPNFYVRYRHVLKSVFEDNSFEDWLPKISTNVKELSKFEANEFQKTADGWRLAFEWEAIQPQRIRLIKPVFYIYSLVSAQLTVKTKIFADSFAEPLLLQAKLNIESQEKLVELADIIPGWNKLLENIERNRSAGSIERLIVDADD